MSNPAVFSAYVAPASQASTAGSGITVARPELATVYSEPYMAPEEPKEAPRERPMYLRSAAPEGSPAASLEPTAPAAPAIAPTIDALTFTNVQGRALPHYMAGPSDRVVIGDMPTSVANALHLGLIREDKVEGGYKLTPEGMARVGQEQAQKRAVYNAAQAEEQAFAQATAMREDIAQLHTKVQTVVPSHILARAFAELGNHTLSPSSLSDLAHFLGVDERKAHGQMLLLDNALEEQAGAALAHAGLTEHDADEFAGWAETMRADELRQARLRHIYSGDLGGYRKLAKEYLSRTRSSREVAYRNAQVDPRLNMRVINGKAVVTIPGFGEVTVEQALKLGLLNASR
jgi:hypothetical protein